MLFSLFRRRSERQHVVARRLFSEHDKAIKAGALVALLEASAEVGVCRDTVLSGTGAVQADLRGPRARISWWQLRTAIDNLERAGVTRGGFEDLGDRMAGSPHLIASRIGSLFLRPEHLLLVALEWVAPALFPVFDRELEYGETIRLTLELPPSMPGCAGYFHLCTGTLRSVPTLIGHPKALIETAITDRRGQFAITCAPYSTGIARVRRVLRAVFTAPAVIRTLAQQDADLRATYERTVETQRQFQTILDSLPDAVVIRRGDVIVYANPVLPRVLDYELASQLCGRRWSELADPVDRARAATGAGGQVRFVRRNGAVAYLELSPAQRIVYDGEPAELTVARDVTERRDIERRLAIADRMASLSALAAGLAHEINNPLTLVISNLQLAARAGGANEAGRGAEFVNAASEGAERVRAIVEALRAFAQPETEASEPIDLAEVVQSSAMLARGKVRPRARLELDLEPVPAVTGSRGALGQVVLNLIINALHALPPRSPEQNRIDVRLRTDGDHVVLEVEDNGSGIPDAVRDRIFEPFFTTKQRGEGTGLGLAVVHEIVVGLSGEISFDTRAGRGTTFRVRLPARAAAPAPPQQRAEARPDDVRPRVLLVDDDRALLRVIGATLGDLGCEVVPAGSGNEALALLDQDDRFDVIVCDLMMADGSGMDVHEQLVARAPELARRIVFMTGGVFRGELSDFLAGVPNECLRKPFGIDQLQDAVSRAAQGRAALH